MTLEQLKYPIGKFKCPTTISEVNINDWIAVLEHFPKQLESIVNPLTDEQLNQSYRDKGWSIRQIVHHIADSHHNSYTRFKWAITEDNPVIKAYDEVSWANQIDYQAPIALSILHIKVIHAKLVYFLKTLKPSQLKRTFIHPDGNEQVALEENLGIYAWHSLHHLEHIKIAIQNGF